MKKNCLKIYFENYCLRFCIDNTIDSPNNYYLLLENKLNSEKEWRGSYGGTFNSFEEAMKRGYQFFDKMNELFK